MGSNMARSIFYLMGGLVLLFFLDISIGSVSIPVDQLIAYLFFDDGSSGYLILWEFRLPKAVTCILAGASLACSGLLMQTLFRNPLAGPDVLGLTSGASLAVGVVILAGRNFLHQTISSSFVISLAASIGSCLVLLLMLLVARRVRDSVSLLIIGLMLAAATSSLMSVLQFMSTADDLQSYFVWTMGNVGGTNWNELGMLFIVFILGVTISFSQLKPLNGWLLGENYARSLGIKIERARLLIVIASGILTGGVTAFCGPIAFVGLAVPHLLRVVVSTSNHKILLPFCVLGGAILLLFCDVVLQFVSSTQSLPLNAITSLIGAPLVIWQVMKMKKVSV
jgi:iron complex transport system permease protein